MTTFPKVTLDVIIALMTFTKTTSEISSWQKAVKLMIFGWTVNLLIFFLIDISNTKITSHLVAIYLYAGTCRFQVYVFTGLCFNHSTLELLYPWHVTHDVLRTQPSWHSNSAFFKIFHNNQYFIQLKAIYSTKADIQVFMTIVHLCLLATSP